MELKNTFLKGTVQKDISERLTDVRELVDAENISIITPEGGQRGVLKNALGNTLISNYNIAGGKTIGEGVNSSKSLIYNFISGTTHDYIIEYNKLTNASTIVLQSSVGSRLNFNPNKRIKNVDIIFSAEGNDLLAWSGDDNPPRIINIERGKQFGINGFTELEIMLMKPAPKYAPNLTPAISNENPESNYLQDRFISFCYRYKYKDGYYSAISSWTEYFFIPSGFKLDYDTFENLGMLNSNNAVDIEFNTGSRDVIQIDLLFKLSNEVNIYVIDKYIKADEVWSDNADLEIQFNNSKVYGVLPESEYYRSFDNVPLTVNCQTIIGSRIAFADFYEGRDMTDVNGNKVIMEYTLELVANNITTGVIGATFFDETYTYETPDVIVNNGLMELDFSGITLVKGFVFFINFNILSDPLELSFINPFSYTLEDDYADLADMFANSEFLDVFENQFTAFFEDNGGISPPDNYIPPYVLIKGFEATQSGDIMSITYPVIKYEIDESPDPNTFTYDYFGDSGTTVDFRSISSSSSMKSLRSYEICMLFLDDEGRKTTAFTSLNNTLFIPNLNAITQNQIKVIIPPSQKVPAWANRYKFGIKQNRGHYEQITAREFFEDDDFVWVKLDGDNRNKVKDNDILTVKKDGFGVLSEVVTTKVLEVKNQPKDFLDDNFDPRDESISEPAGLYMKLRPNNFEISYNTDEFQRYKDKEQGTESYKIMKLGALNRLENGSWVDIPLKQGSVVDLRVTIRGNTNTTLDKSWNVQNDYASFEAWWLAVIDPTLPFTTGGGIPYVWDNFSFETDDIGRRFFVIVTPSRGYTVVQASLFIRSVDGFFIFETQPKETTDGIFFETPETYDIVNRNYQMTNHLLTRTFNCFCFGNGAESYQIRDGYNEKELAIDFCPTAVSKDEYRQIRRFADITYSEVYQESTNVNKLNEFNLYLANFKDDIEKSFGAIVKMKGFDTNLDIIQEDKYSIVYYGKDLLYNADGGTNLTGVPQVLGQQKALDGEFGTQYPDSFDFYGFNRYFLDVKRGTVMKKSNNGLFPISTQGMTEYFRRLLRDNIINEANGKYDQYLGVYILNIKYNNGSYVTWLYSDEANGWLTRQTFNPESMIRMNGDFFSFKNGEVYQHNSTNLYNTFYGVESPSKWGFNFSQEPSVRKNYKTLSSEGTVKPDVIVTTDLDSGYINKEDFERKEGVEYAYLRNSNAVIDTSMLSTQGVGEVTISGNVLTCSVAIDNIISEGDAIRNVNLDLVGTVVSRTEKTLTLNAVANIVSGDFVMATKEQSIENQSLCGYYMRVDCEFSSTTKQEIFSINTEVSKSFP